MSNTPEQKDKIITELVNEIEQLILHVEEDSLDYSILENARRLVFRTKYPDQAKGLIHQATYTIK